jgi:hypothetical protein
MCGESVRFDTPQLLLIGGTGSIAIAPAGAATDPEFLSPPLMEVPAQPPNAD